MFKFTFWTLPMKHPVKAATLAAIARSGQDIWERELKDYGFDTSDPNFPDWLRGAIPIGFDLTNPDKKTVSFWGTKGINPFTTATDLELKKIASASGPLWKLIMERVFQEDIFRGKKFDAPYVTTDTVTGQMYRLQPGTGKVERISGVNPPLLEHIARTIPQYQFLEQCLWTKEYGAVPQMYSTSTIFTPKPKLDKAGQLKQKQTLTRKLSGLMGVPLYSYSPTKTPGQAKTLKRVRTALGKKYATYPIQVKKIKKGGQK
jgi:hypothetical protein